eukprot:10221704-Alexandrium_andersonii.AAC.1
MFRDSLAHAGHPRVASSPQDRLEPRPARLGISRSGRRPLRADSGALPAACRVPMLFQKPPRQ